LLNDNIEINCNVRRGIVLELLLGEMGTWRRAYITIKKSMTERRNCIVFPVYEIIFMSKA
jgi:hypothetical protein